MKTKLSKNTVVPLRRIVQISLFKYISEDYLRKIACIFDYLAMCSVCERVNPPMLRVHLTLQLLVANRQHKMIEKKSKKKTETLSHRYSSESTQQELPT